jgi:hypothetical protein
MQNVELQYGVCIIEAHEIPTFPTKAVNLSRHNPC